MYQVKRGDNLLGIAKAGGYNYDKLLAANPQIKNPNLIFPGQQLRTPHTMATRDSMSSIPRGPMLAAPPKLMQTPQRLASPMIVSAQPRKRKSMFDTLVGKFKSFLGRDELPETIVVGVRG